MAETSPRRDPVGDPATLLREHGVQVTAQRIAVLRTISAHSHISAPEVAEAVRDQIGAISRQAVYDTLNVLTEHELIRAIQPAGSPTRYEDRVGDNHHHLVCREQMVRHAGAHGTGSQESNSAHLDLLNPSYGRRARHETH